MHAPNITPCRCTITSCHTTCVGTCTIHDTTWCSDVVIVQLVIFASTSFCKIYGSEIFMVLISIFHGQWFWNQHNSWFNGYKLSECLERKLKSWLFAPEWKDQAVHQTTYSRNPSQPVDLVHGGEIYGKNPAKNRSHNSINTSFVCSNTD